VIFGKKGHAEVEGIVGQTDGKAIVVSSPDEVEHAVLQGDVYLFSQTTMGKDEYENVAAQLAKKIGSDKKVVKTNSICGQVSCRIPWAVELASKNDVVVFVSGKNSSNGKMLYQHCLAVNPSTYFVCEPAELRPEWFENSTTVGVCGATSTPLWQLEKIADAIRGLTF
jgi:4-hydroxy-3-methylbut-2-en-1-yl diphosphate reductase